MQSRKEWLGGFKEGTLRHEGPRLSRRFPASAQLFSSSVALSLSDSPLSPPPSPLPAEALIEWVTHQDAPRIPLELIPAQLSPQEDQVGSRLGCL